MEEKIANDPYLLRVKEAQSIIGEATGDRYTTEEVSNFIGVIADSDAMKTLKGQYESVFSNLTPEKVSIAKKQNPFSDFIKQVLDGSVGSMSDINLDALKLGQRNLEMLKSLSKLGAQDWQNFYDRALAESVENDAPEVVESVFAKLQTGHVYSSCRQITGHDFNSVAMAGEEKYELARAVLKCQQSKLPGHVPYEGHSFPALPNNGVSIIVAKDAEQVRKVLGSLQKELNMRSPYSTESELTEKIVKFTAVDNVGRRQSLFIVPEKFLQENLGQGMDYAKAYEQEAKKTRLYTTDAGHETLEQYLHRNSKYSEKVQDMPQSKPVPMKRQEAPQEKSIATGIFQL